MSRRGIVAVAVAVAITLTLGLGASSAFADSVINVSYAGNAVTNGEVRVAVSAPTPISSITVTVRDPQTGDVDATVTQFALISGSTDIFESTSRVNLPALGDYPLDVTVTDTGGDSVSVPNAGVLMYLLVPQFGSFTASRSTVDILHQRVTFSGRLVGDRPSDGALVPIPSAAVEIDSNSGGILALPVTDSNGDFSVTLAVSVTDVYFAQYTVDDNPQLPFTGTTVSAPMTITVVPEPTRILETVPVGPVPAGQPVTVTGTLQWKSPTGWRPLAGQHVAAFNATYFHLYGIATTDSHGMVSFEVDNFEGTLTVELAVQADSAPWYQLSTSTATVEVLAPSVFSRFDATRTDARHVELSGDVSFPGYLSPGQASVDIEFSGSGSGPWRTIATGIPGYWDGTGYGFDATVSSSVSGYWRAVAAEPGFEAATSDSQFIAKS